MAAEKQSRDHAGRYGEMVRGASGVTLPHPSEDGSYLHPPSFVGWEAERYVEFWRTVPIDDGILQNVRTEYAAHIEQEQIKYCQEHGNAWKVTDPDPTEGVTETIFNRKRLDERGDAWSGRARAEWRRLEEEFYADRPKSMPSFVTRDAVRAHKAHFYSSLLDEQESAAVHATEFPVGGQAEPLLTAIERYRLYEIDGATYVSAEDVREREMLDAIRNLARSVGGQE